MVWCLMQCGFSAREAWDMSPDDADRFLAISNAMRTQQSAADGRAVELVRPGVRRATQADFDKF